MGKRAIAAALPLALAACGGGEEVGERGEPIIRGGPATAYPEAVLVDMLQRGRVTAACSGALIARRVVLTAGHCVHSFDGWRITAPYASMQSAAAGTGATYDWDDGSGAVNPGQHDLGLIFLDRPITLGAYPSLLAAPLADGGRVLDVGRIDDGHLSSTDLFVGRRLTVRDAAREGYPFDYVAEDVIESGDSGGPALLPGTHVIAAVSSGAGGEVQVLARVDLLVSWIAEQAGLRVP